MDNNEKFVQRQIIAPFANNQRVLQSLQAQASGTLEGLDPVFDLDFGPPISTNERFVLSRDGLYYNSRTASVPSIVPNPVSSDMWNLQYDSNRGGRGLSFTEEDGGKYSRHNIRFKYALRKRKSESCELYFI